MRFHERVYRRCAGNSQRKANSLSGGPFARIRLKIIFVFYRCDQEFANNFQTSKKMIAEASAAAVASAKMNVQQVYQSSTRVRLDVFADVSETMVN